VSCIPWSRAGVARRAQVHESYLAGLRWLCVVLRGAVLRHRPMAPAGQRLDQDKESGRAMALVLVVAPLNAARRCRQRPLHVSVQNDGLLVQAQPMRSTYSSAFTMRAETVVSMQPTSPHRSPSSPVPNSLSDEKPSENRHLSVRRRSMRRLRTMETQVSLVWQSRSSSLLTCRLCPLQPHERSTPQRRGRMPRKPVRAVGIAALVAEGDGGQSDQAPVVLWGTHRPRGGAAGVTTAPCQPTGSSLHARPVPVSP
jgi:hypothetical protein